MSTFILLLIVALNSQIDQKNCQIDEIIIWPRAAKSVYDYMLHSIYTFNVGLFTYSSIFLFISLHANRRAQNYTIVIIVGTQHCKERHLDFSHVKKNKEQTINK